MDQQTGHVTWFVVSSFSKNIGVHGCGHVCQLNTNTTLQNLVESLPRTATGTKSGMEWTKSTFQRFSISLKLL